MSRRTIPARSRALVAGLHVIVVLALGLLAAGPIGLARVQAAPARMASEGASDQIASQAGLVREAFNAIYSRYFNPVSAADLLNAAWSAAAGAAQDAGNYTPPPRPGVSGNTSSAFMRFADAYQQLEAATAIEPTELAYSAIRGMVGFIGNCHTYFLAPPAAAAQRASLSGQELVGAGYRRQYHGSPPWAITYIVPGGPSDRAGLRPGDEVLAYDGDGSANAPSTHAKLEGETLMLTIRRPGVAGTSYVPVVIGRYRFPQIETRVVAGNVGYIRFFTWEDSDSQARAIRETIANFERQGVTSWVLDVRANGGGVPDWIAKLFIAAGVIAQEQLRDGATFTLTADGSAIAPARPLAILVGSGSASASEIVPEAIREAGDAVLVGEHTEGCMAATSETRLSDGSSIWVTTEHVLVGNSGRDFEGVGVEPDIVAPQTAADLAAGRDPGLDAAVAYLQRVTTSPAPAAIP